MEVPVAGANGRGALWPWAFPYDRKDHYRVEGEELWADEVHCLDPACDRVETHFVENEYEAGIHHVGGVGVHLAWADGAWRQASTGREGLLERAWAAYRTRHRRFPERLAARRRHLLDLLAGRGPVAMDTAVIDAHGPCRCARGR